MVFNAKQKGVLFIVLIVVALISAGLLWYQSGIISVTPPEDDLVFCTQDAKQCPDGSYVGRVAPNCSFAPCPGL